MPRFDEPSRGPKEDLPIGDLSSTAESDQEFEVGGDLINGSWHRDVCERGPQLVLGRADVVAREVAWRTA